MRLFFSFYFYFSSIFLAPEAAWRTGTGPIHTRGSMPDVVVISSSSDEDSPALPPAKDRAKEPAAGESAKRKRVLAVSDDESGEPEAGAPRGQRPVARVAGEAQQAPEGEAANLPRGHADRQGAAESIEGVVLSEATRGMISHFLTTRDEQSLRRIELSVNAALWDWEGGVTCCR